MTGWPTAARVLTLAILSFFVLGGLAEVEAWSGSTAAVVGCALGWAALALRAWSGGRLALFFAIVPVFVMPSALIGVQLAGPACGIRPFGPEVRSREGQERLWPVPHEVCRMTLADGSRVTDGGPPRDFFIAFGWAALATGLALARRPSLPARAGIVVVTLLLATFALFI